MKCFGLLQSQRRYQMMKRQTETLTLSLPTQRISLVQAEMSYLHFDLCTGAQTFSAAFVDKGATIWKENRTPGDIKHTVTRERPTWIFTAMRPTDHRRSHSHVRVWLPGITDCSPLPGSRRVTSWGGETREKMANLAFLGQEAERPPKPKVKVSAVDMWVCVTDNT